MAFATPDKRGRRSRRKPFAEINIIPLTDVMMVLLIIFMVTAQFIAQQPTGLNLNLPSAKQVDNLDSLGGLRVSVDKAGNLQLDGVAVQPDGLEAALKQAMKSPQQLVIVEGDRDTVLQNVVQIMDAAMAAGLPNVVLATAAEPGATPGPPPGPGPAAGPAPAAPRQPAAATSADKAAPATGDTPFVTP